MKLSVKLSVLSDSVVRIFSFTLFLLLTSTCFSQDIAVSNNHRRIKHKLGGGAVISFYTNHPKHTINTKAKPGAVVFYKAEIHIVRKTGLLLGLEYMSQGLSFRGYYTAPGYTYFFDKTFAYTHELRYNELQLPVSVKLALNKDKDSKFVAYVYGGPGARYIINSSAVIINDSTGTAPYDGRATIGFENELLFKKFNGFLHAGFGIQKNLGDTGRSWFFESTFKYGLSRIHYTGRNNSNNLNIKEMNVSFLLGYKF